LFGELFIEVNIPYFEASFYFSLFKSFILST